MKYLLRTTGFAAMLASFLVFSATVADGQDEGAINIETNLVNLGVVAMDRKGAYVTSLGKNDFEVFDNGRKQEIALFSDEAAPVSYGFVYDLHPTTSDRTKRVLDSIRTFTERLAEKDDFFTVVFNERGSLVLDFVPSADQVARHLSLGEKGEPNSLYDAIALAAEKSEERANVKRTLVVITDGKDDDSHHSYSSLNKKLRGFNVQIFAVFIDDDSDWTYSDLTMERQPRRLDRNLTLDRAALDELVRRTGGRAQEPVAENLVDLVGIYNRISLEMKNQYSLGFYPERPDGKWHKIEVRVAIPSGGGKLKLVYRKGYQSPEPGPGAPQ